MKTKLAWIAAGLLTLGACNAGGQVGDECAADEDCADGLECHMHDGEEDHGECEEHEEGDDHDHDE